MTPFDEEEERKRWSEMGGMSPGQLSTPQAESPESVAMRWLGGRNDAPAPAMAQPDMPEVPEPPMMQSNNGGIIAAAIADLVLNKGRSLGTLIGHMSTSGDAVAKENWQRQRQHALDQASISHQMREGRGEDPRVLAARERALELQARGLGLQERQFDARQESSAGAREAAIALGADPELVGKMSDQQVAQWKSAITGQLRQQGSNQAWDERYGVGGVRDQVAVGKEARAASEFDRRTEIDEGNKVAGEGRASDRKLVEESRASGRVDAHRDEDFATRYAEKNQNELDIAALIQDVEKSPGGVPPGFFERFRNSITARGIDPARMESWQSKHMVLELWARSQSGMAISQTEDGRFMTQVGLNPTASAEQVESAYNVLGRVVDRRLRGAAVANPEVARRVGVEAYGLDPDRWFGAGKPSRATGPVPSVNSSPVPKASDVHEPPAGKVLVQEPGPAGKVGYIRADQLKEALRRGARRIQ